MNDKDDQLRKSQKTDGTGAEPQEKQFWAHPWFIAGVAVLAGVLIFMFMNREPWSIRYIGINKFEAPPLTIILICMFAGAAIEFFVTIGPRASIKHENRELKRRVHELEKRIGH